MSLFTRPNLKSKHVNRKALTLCEGAFCILGGKFKSKHVNKNKHEN